MHHLIHVSYCRVLKEVGNALMTFKHTARTKKERNIKAVQRRIFIRIYFNAVFRSNFFFFKHFRSFLYFSFCKVDVVNYSVLAKKDRILSDFCVL